ncbi:uncharacterized protein M421DRAFT_423446 [Didymella exigua CBS 183.55]|uniref:Uncharacterized protein n=1 Tax=Didymella exigua CBS 183.55 TaxID=1150837 RepID=A0A6A5RD28_9PLEO|nr:uncharacterized protein M421DRAFT_423446 [Didymella exigua CBS 183.55]KAF1925612.1 hypothetical protein M421DRAFT_423446 [Didymella exigua CBS 183.55]
MDSQQRLYLIIVFPVWSALNGCSLSGAPTSRRSMYCTAGNPTTSGDDARWAL